MSTGTTEAPAKDAPAKDALPARIAPQKIIVQDDGPLSFMMDTGRFEQLQRVARVMASSSLLPDHLCMEGKGQNKQLMSIETIQANCFRIVNQAMRWQIDPFAMVDETYVVGGKLGYSGKLVAAIVNARAGLVGRLTYQFTGTGLDRTITVCGTFPGADPVTIKLSVKEAKTDNQMWTKDPDQKLVYSGATKWARRYCPEVVLGVLTDDDLERIRLEREQPVAVPGETKLDRLANSFGDSIPPASGAESPKPETSGEVSSFAPQHEEKNLAYVSRLRSEISAALTAHTLDEIQHQITNYTGGEMLNEDQAKTLVNLIGKKREEQAKAKANGQLM